MLAAIGVGFSPILLATNGLFQPVSFDSLATIVVLWLALRLLLGRGSWIALGVAVGIGLETKYTLAIPLVLLVAAVAVWRRDLLRSRGVLLAAAIAAVLIVPNLVWEAQHGWVSVHWFVNPPPSATDESRPGYIVDLLITMNLFAVPALVAGVVALHRNRALRPLAWTVVGTAVTYFALGGKSYYAVPRTAVRARRRRSSVRTLGDPETPLHRQPSRSSSSSWWRCRRSCRCCRCTRRTHTASSRAAATTRTSSAGRSSPVSVDANAGGNDVVLARNYGEAGALELFGHGLPPVASPNVTFRYWRPAVSGREALLVGFTSADATFCARFRVVARIAMPVKNQERGQPVARCDLRASLAQLWPSLVTRFGE